ncbi:hypothetical protein Prudu_010684 [Prunus dulcis]|uniref:Uncharacterized protein n=1 Tax=Prunus dulcis TaxID=3755 RepID=A0A4Y1R8X5_PRUDU|nr:hypothetical protein Prudu_010684 [Prunus dulcis]
MAQKFELGQRQDTAADSATCPGAPPLFQNHSIIQFQLQILSSSRSVPPSSSETLALAELSKSAQCLTMKPSSRYSSYDARSSTSSHFSDPSSSTELKLPTSSRAVVKSKASDPNIATMMKTFMEKRSTSKAKPIKATGLMIPSDLIAGDLKNMARNGAGSNLTALGRKLFGKGTGTTSSDKKKEVKALTEVKGNTRTLAMVLRSERELLNLNKEKEVEIAELKLMLEEKNRELQEMLEKQGSELKQAKQVIPNLQRQVTSLTGQLQCLAEDLAEVKADKCSVRARFQRDDSSPRTPTYDDNEPSNSVEFSSGDPTSPGSPDDMFLKDLNPCLTPYYAKTKSKEFDEMGYDSPYGHHESLSQNKMEFGFNFCAKKLSRSSDCSQKSEAESRIAQANRRLVSNLPSYAQDILTKSINSMALNVRVLANIGCDNMRIVDKEVSSAAVVDSDHLVLGTRWYKAPGWKMKSSRWSTDIGDSDNWESPGIKKVKDRYGCDVLFSICRRIAKP